MSKRIVYPRICFHHPNISDNLYYVYRGGRLGQLLCEECRENERKDYANKRKMFDLRQNKT